MSQPLTIIVQNSTHTPLSVTAQKDSGAAVDLTGLVNSNITVTFSGPSRFTGGGTVTITTATAGQFTYAWGTADLATLGDFQLQFIANYGTNNVQYFDPIDIRIIAPL